MKKTLIAILLLALALTLGCAKPPKQAGRHTTQLKDFDEAVTSYQKALEDDPDSVTLLTGLGRAYYKLDEYDKAEDTFRAATEVQPEYPPATFYLGLCAIAKGNHGAGYKILREFRYPGKLHVTESVHTVAQELESDKTLSLETIETRLFKAWDDALVMDRDGS